jgi:hypothetical protein
MIQNSDAEWTYQRVSASMLNGNTTAEAPMNRPPSSLATNATAPRPEFLLTGASTLTLTVLWWWYPCRRCAARSNSRTLLLCVVYLGDIHYEPPNKSMHREWAFKNLLMYRLSSCVPDSPQGNKDLVSTVWQELSRGFDYQV